MDKEDCDPLSDRLLQLTLEIIFLLTGENYVVVRKPGGGGGCGRPSAAWSRAQGPVLVAPPPSLMLEKSSKQKILEVISNMAELLTAEGASRCGRSHPQDAVSGHGRAQGNVKADPAGVSAPSCCKKERAAASQECKATMTVTIAAKEEEEEEVKLSSDSDSCRKEPQVELNQGSSNDLTKEPSPVDPDVDSGVYSPIEPDVDTGVYSAAELGTITVKEEPDLCEIRNLIDFVGQEQDSGSSPGDQRRANPVFSCSRCDKSFENHLDLLNHHGLTCSECGRCFAYKSQLIFHMRSHTGEKPFICSLCGKSFATSGVLIRHQITHTGEKLFSCTDCEKCFGSKSDLAIHQRIHTGLKPYMCASCGTCFNTTSGLARHRRIHTGQKPFPCSLCKKSFVNSTDLVNHQRIHTGERPFSCPDCGKRFTCKSGLAKHQRTHCKQTRYSCPDCEATFHAVSKLKQHQKSHRHKS